VQELRVAGLDLLCRLERGGELLGRGGELEVGEMATQLLQSTILKTIAHSYSNPRSINIFPVGFSL
jgi:hypothetical protein